MSVLPERHRTFQLPLNQTHSFRRHAARKKTTKRIWQQPLDGVLSDIDTFLNKVV